MVNNMIDIINLRLKIETAAGIKVDCNWPELGSY